MTGQEQQDIDRLARFTLQHKWGENVSGYDALQSVVRAASMTGIQAELGLPEEVTAADTLAGLRLLAVERQDLDRCERKLIEAAKDRGATWETLGAALGQSGQAVQQRYKRLGGQRSWPTPPPRRSQRPAVGDTSRSCK